MELNFGHTDGRTDKRTDGWTDKRGSRNSYLDVDGISKYDGQTEGQTNVKSEIVI